MGYPAVRSKTLPRRSGIVHCGFAPLLQTFQDLQSGVDFELTFVVNRQNAQLGDDIAGSRRWSEDEYSELVDRFSFIREVVFRPNLAADIGGYDFGYRRLRERGFSGDVLFINSSVAGPKDHGWLKKYHDLFRKRPDTGLCGTAVNMIPFQGHATLQHVHSWFLYSSMPVLEKIFAGRLIDDLTVFRTRKDLILHGEIAISQAVLKAGYSICCSAYPELSFREGGKWEYPFRLGWRSDPAFIHLANTIL